MFASIQFVVAKTRGVPKLGALASRGCAYTAAKPLSARGQHKLLDVTHAPSIQNLDNFGMDIFPDFISERQEEEIVKELHKHLRRRRYEAGHWDGVIRNYREISKSRSTLGDNMLATVQSVQAAGFSSDDQKFVGDPVHVLDLADDGQIMNHVDNIKFSGDYVVGLCLLSDAIMRLKHEHSDEFVDCLLPRRTLYSMRGEARYDWGHAVLPSGERFMGRPLIKTRRITLLLRDEKRQPESMLKFEQLSDEL